MVDLEAYGSSYGRSSSKILQWQLYCPNMLKNYQWETKLFGFLRDANRKESQIRKNDVTLWWLRYVWARVHCNGNGCATFIDAEEKKNKEKLINNKLINQSILSVYIELASLGDINKPVLVFSRIKQWNY